MRNASRTRVFTASVLAVLLAVTSALAGGPAHARQRQADRLADDGVHSAQGAHGAHDLHEVHGTPSDALQRAARFPAAADDCPNATLPPPPVDTSEKPPPGIASPAPPEVPATPAGGERMGDCGVVTPHDAPPPPDDITSAAFLVQDLDTGAVIAAKNPHGRYRPASLIKTLLALVVLEELPLDAALTATKADAEQECTCVGLVEGGEYEVGVLVRALLMRSGNDVAHALATALGGTRAAVDKMNDLADRLGTTDTHAATPSGLDGAGMMTSAYDMSMIFRYAMGDPDYARAVGTKKIDFPGGPGEPSYPVYNDNPLWGSYEGFLGGKTGFTDDARHTYAGAAEQDGRRLAIVMLRTEQEPVRLAEQAHRLLDYGFALGEEGAEPVGRVLSARAASALDGAEDGEDSGASPSGLGVSEASSDDPFGPTGWIVTLVVTALVLLGLLVTHRKGLLRRPD